MKTVLLATAVALATMSAVASDTVITRAQQRALAAEAQYQHDVAVKVRAALERGAGRDEVEDILFAAIDRWDGLQYSDLVKSGLAQCKQTNADLLELAVSLRSSQRSATFEAQKRKHVSEDMEICVQELTYPRRSLIEATEDYGVVLE